MQNHSFLEETFKQDYHTGNWKDILLKIFPHVSFFKTPELMELPESKEEDAKNIYRYGTITLGDGKTIDLYEVELQDGKSVTRNRVGLRNLLHNYVISGLVDGVIATYYNKNTNDWRLSFISKKAYWDDEQGLLKEETHPKRYTFVLGKNESIKTALQRIQLLIKLVTQGHVIGIEDLLRAFSVQKISKEFFDEYKRNYQAFAEFLGTRTYRELFTPEGKDLTEDEQKKETERNISNFAKKLLGRIVFLYFLQKKGWLGVPKNEPWGNGERDFVSKLFNDCEDKNSFYEQSLVPLFFETLNKKRADNLFKLTGTKVPFLNGGLFDKITNETTEIKFEPQLFEDLFLFFNNYNFTIDENSPDDLDIGIDPEMLGLIFENLLEENRKRTGAFYTPKEVVHYMCKESLSLYLQKQLSDKLNAEEIKVLDSFIKQTNADTPGLIKTHADDIQRQLDRVKICDPAIGSGAFPLGILFEILRIRKEIFPHLSKQKNFSYRNEKLNIMRNNIYGVDIDSGAVDIARLRFWLSLIVDEEEPSPLPNLDYKIMQGDSMMESFENIDLSKVKTKAKNIKVFEPERDLFGNIKNAQLTINSAPFDTEALEEKVRDFFKIDDSDEKRKKHNEIDNDVLKHIEERCAEYRMILLEKEQTAQKVYDLAKSNLKTDIQLERFASGKEANSLALWQNKLVDLDRIDHRLHQIVNQTERPYFLWHLFFKDVFDNGGFDIVIGNPPYGVSFSDELKNQYELASKDSYGIFMAHAIKHLLKPNGTCTFIVSDTWLTIKSHLPLRELVLEKQLHKIIRLPADTFGAMVNTCIYIQSNSAKNEKSLLIAADLTNLSPQKRLPEFRDTLFNLEKYIGIYTLDFAVYQYPQQLISINTNHPIFVASPKLFTLMNDTTCPIKKQNEGTVEGLNVRLVQVNDKQIELVRFGDIAEIKQGLATGDNHYYIYQSPDARGSYKDINQFSNYLLTNSDIRNIGKNEKIRLKIVEKGFHKSKDEPEFDIDRWVDGKYIVPYDKGGESDTDTGWLPNYYVPTNYFIDWSTQAIKRLETYTIAQRIKEYKESKKITERYKSTTCAVIRSRDTYFKPGVSFSRTGVYAPTFRLSSHSVYDTEGSTIFFSKDFSPENYIGVLCSKLNKYLLKNFLGHTIHTQVDELKETPLNIKEINFLDLLNSIINKQNASLRYDYQGNEQKKIDALVYDAYGLNKADINEVETWYARRYPKMAKYADMVSQDEIVEKLAEEIANESLYAKRVRELIELGENI
ncbi:BREX-1 system adenine-specific DNA-methyltransferase PglX [Mucilaginibacter sp. RB4R14]|uniref:Eco57I restriction-modification methylase domain-containing protein n=1 Tax=Mucilaginibacter aurantiaciroseus TaxID=2949308 RepID=UPI0020913420|nr:N-6 DNA methylase [Mucilaginibacter aurantiaciroseus]MCO5936907.1 BREX-1 system adenine-specific DNA-methyltransferase PglX [Mucilaginibacter aurantiaciroseus]